jgi:hypothetical protein
MNLANAISKSKTKILLFGIIFQLVISISAQEASNEVRASLTVLNIDTKGISYDQEQMGNLVRLEVDKLKIFEVMDKYDVAYMIEKHKLNIGNCYGKICLVEVGKTINSDKMLSGSVEMYGETIIISMRLVDVKTERTEITQVNEFLNLPNELQPMISMTIREMFGLEVNAQLATRLTKKFNYESTITNPNTDVLKLTGPRMGFTAFTGKSYNYVVSPEEKGGFDAFPVMFQFGYQFEKQYLNEGKMQALFEFIPMVTILDQNNFVPSFVILNGLRNNIKGWEVGCGLSFYINKKASGYYSNGNWYLEGDGPYPISSENPNPIEERVDSRGNSKFATNFVIAAGKTFKSGKLNIPVNMYAVPTKQGVKIGVSFGFNAKKKEVVKN